LRRAVGSLSRPGRREARLTGAVGRTLLLWDLGLPLFGLFQPKFRHLMQEPCRGRDLISNDPYAVPHTSRATSTMRDSFATCDSRAISLPCTVLEKPHCGERHSCSSGTMRRASSMRRFKSDFDSSSPTLVVTSPRTTVFPLGTKRSGVKSPER